MGQSAQDERLLHFCPEELCATGVPRLNSNKDLKSKSIIVMKACDSYKPFLPSWMLSVIHQYLLNTYSVPDTIAAGASVPPKETHEVSALTELTFSRVGLGKTEN